MRNKLLTLANTLKKPQLVMVGATLVLGMIAGSVFMPTRPVQGEASTFDHSNCQYPDRTTNPPDGCDNTDPCDPATTKGGSGDCKDGPCAGYPNGVCESCPDNSCTGKDQTPPDPNRPYYDDQGNKYDYKGNLIEAAPQPAPSSCTGK